MVKKESEIYVQDFMLKSNLESIQEVSIHLDKTSFNK